MADHVLQIGAPDPERKISPILDEYEEISLDMEIEAGVCYFNDSPYPIGAYVLRAAKCCIARSEASGCAKLKCGRVVRKNSPSRTFGGASTTDSLRMDPLTVLPSGSFSARAMLLGERIDLRSRFAGEVLARNPLTVPVKGGGVAVLFRYGAVVQ